LLLKKIVLLTLEDSLMFDFIISTKTLLT